MAGYFDLVINYYAALKILPLSAATSALVGYQVAFSRQRQHGPFKKNIKDGPKDDTNQLDEANAKLLVIPNVEAPFYPRQLDFGAILTHIPSSASLLVLYGVDDG